MTASHGLSPIRMHRRPLCVQMKLAISFLALVAVAAGVSLDGSNFESGE